MAHTPHNHDHDHGHHGHDHKHEYKSVAMGRLRWSLAITAVVLVVEAVGGWLTGSIALVGDAGHMLTHAFAIAVSMFGILIARRPACHHRTFGLLRAEVLAALANGVFLVVVSVGIIVESVHRFLEPREILTAQMLVIAALGLVVNVVSILLLQGSREKDLNIRAVFLHMVGDAASSVAIVIAAVIIHFTDWTWLDPVLGVAISVWICVWAGGLLKDSCRVLLEMAPKGHNVHDISHAMMAQFPEIRETTNEHLWTITEEVIVFSAHLSVNHEAVQPAEMNAWLEMLERWLAAEYGVVESTLQVRTVEGPEAHEAQLEPE